MPGRPASSPALGRARSSSRPAVDKGLRPQGLSARGAGVPLPGPARCSGAGVWLAKSTGLASPVLVLGFRMLAVSKGNPQSDGGGWSVASGGVGGENSFYFLLSFPAPSSSSLQSKPKRAAWKGASCFHGVLLCLRGPGAARRCFGPLLC